MEMNDKNPQHTLPREAFLDNYTYQVGSVIGEGGFGITYKGRNRVGTVVAIKECFPRSEVNRDSQTGNDVNWRNDHKKYTQKLIEEAKRVAKIQNCPTIVPVRDAFFDNKTAYIVMDYVEGITLGEYVRQKGKLAFSDCVKLLAPLMEDLGRIHEEYHLIHRDISPNNIMVQKDGTVRLLDFGAAKIVQPENLQNGTPPSQLIGTPHFRAFEQLDSTERIHTWTDVYALTATIFFCITGEAPPDVIRRMKNPILDIPDYLSEPISAKTKAILNKGLAVYPQDRYQDVNQLLSALKNELNFVWFEKVKDVVVGNKVETVENQISEPQPASIPQPKRNFKKIRRSKSIQKKSFISEQLSDIFSFFVVLVIIAFFAMLCLHDIKQGLQYYVKQGRCTDTVTWRLDEDTLYIDGSGDMKDYDNDSPWLSQSKKIKNIVISEEITSIGSYSFSNCTNLTRIIIPNSVTEIGYSAFKGCRNLTSVTIPDSVTVIQSSVFSGCANLTNITIPDSVTAIGHYSFKKCTSLTSITIPDSVTIIGSKAFLGCKNLKNIIIPSSTEVVPSPWLGWDYTPTFLFSSN